MPSDARTRAHDIPPDVLAVLVLPDPAIILEDQRRGALCVWDKTPLTLATAVDLGELDSPIGRWWPRSCPACVADRAHRGLLEHAPGCEDCRKQPSPGEPTVCETARVLYRLVKEGRRHG